MLKCEGQMRNYTCSTKIAEALTRPTDGKIIFLILDSHSSEEYPISNQKCPLLKIRNFRES
jgi:hypothetical protein